MDVNVNVCVYVSVFHNESSSFQSKGHLDTLRTAKTNIHINVGQRICSHTKKKLDVSFRV